MDKETIFVLNDISEILEDLTEVVRELNPGARYGKIEFLLGRVTRRLEEIAVATAAR